MFRFFLTRVLLPLLLFLILRYIFKTLSENMKARGSTQGTAGAVPHVRTGGELKKDPVCGTYVSADTAVTREVAGEVVHFCSVSCRDRYQV